VGFATFVRPFSAIAQGARRVAGGRPPSTPSSKQAPEKLQLDGF